MTAGSRDPQLRREDGFTVIEMLVAMFIIGIVFTAFALVVSTTIRHSALITSESVTQHQARSALNQLTEDLREATVSSDTDTSPFVTAAGVMSPTTLTFYAPDGSYDGSDPTDYHLREISYQLSGGVLGRTSVVSSNVAGPPWTLPALGSTYSPLVESVVNSAVFTYLDGSQPPVPTTNPAAVRTVVVTLTVTVPGITHQFTYSDSATLRETPPT